MYVQVTADRTGGRSQGVGSTKEDTALLDHVLTLPDHGDNGARGHVLDQTREEGLALEVGVVLGKPKGTYLLEVVLTSVHELHGHKLEATVLEALDDLADETALDAVGLNHDVGWVSGYHLLCSVAMMKVEDEKKRARRQR